MDLYNFIILLSPSVVIIAALTYAVLMRYIAYRERVSLAERGVDIDLFLRSEHVGNQGNRGVLWAGTITTASGLAIVFGLWMIGHTAWLIAGFLPLFIGLGILGIYYVTRGSTAALPRDASIPSTCAGSSAAPQEPTAG